MLRSKIYIYKIWFPTSGKVYIGITCRLKKRMMDHLKAESLVGRALRKYDDWTAGVLHVVKTRDEANTIEIEEIRNFNSIHPNGYNLTRGGDGLAGYWKGRKRSKQNNENNRQAQLGKNHSEETKKKIGMASKEYHNRPEVKSKNAEFMRIRMKGNSYFKGYTHSEETKSNLVKRNRSNNPMNNKISKLKWKISRMKTSIANLEKVGK